MYLPQHFAQTDIVRLHDFIEQHSFGLLVSQHDREPLVSHLPLLLDRNSGPHGELIGHVARANSQWQQAEGARVLAVFLGPHAYISPAWYEAENVVPTWNYTAVHAYGQFQVIHDPIALTRIVESFVETYERGRSTPWRLDGSPQFIERMVAQIVGFRIPIERLEGKWKLSQNHPVERREKLIRELSQSPDSDAQAIAALMQQALDLS